MAEKLPISADVVAQPNIEEPSNVRHMGREDEMKGLGNNLNIPRGGAGDNAR